MRWALQVNEYFPKIYVCVLFWFLLVYRNKRKKGFRMFSCLRAGVCVCRIERARENEIGNTMTSFTAVFLSTILHHLLLRYSTHAKTWHFPSHLWQTWNKVTTRSHLYDLPAEATSMDETKQKQPRKSSGKNCRKHTTTKTNIILNLYLSVNRSKMCSVLTLLQHSTPKNQSYRIKCIFIRHSCLKSKWFIRTQLNLQQFT